MPRYSALTTGCLALSLLVPATGFSQDDTIPGAESAQTLVVSQSAESDQISDASASQITSEIAENSLNASSSSTASQISDDTSFSSNSDPGRCYESFTYANALMRAENAYVRRRYTTVIEILQPIYENIQCIDDQNGVIELELLLGVAYFEKGNSALADTFFLNVLRTEPDHIVGSVITLPETSARRIETLRTEHAEELDKLRSQMSPNTIIESLYVLTEKEEHPYWLNFLPFGVGVFQMHETTWGAIYASLQSAGIVMSILGGGMVEYYRGDNYSFTSKNYAHAKNWQTIQIIGISLIAAGYVSSVIHALIIHEDSTMIIHSPTQTRPDISSVSPFILPDGAGIAYGSQF